MADSKTEAAGRRPSPKVLLDLAAREGRAKLKVFLGMAPGVGKTYAMLATAKALKAQGVDVVVGVVETHGRSETAALLDGMEVLPRQTVSYRNRTIMEFDIDAAIARRPALMLVDEFAHSNVPGLIHTKRYQDVEGILQAGIDVWTTLNIQHLESLTDVVARITGITVTETVPDRVLERADEVVVVDLPPEELIQRLKDGKVYLPENARRAMDQFFKASNLTALRELALRRTADRVDEQMLELLRQQGIEGPMHAAERMLICVGSGEDCENVVRVAGRMAQAQKCDLMALYLSPGNREITDRSVLKRTDKALRLAERLGATSIRLNSEDLVGDALAYARRNNITQIVVGPSNAGRIDTWLGRNFTERLMSEAKGLSITVVASDKKVKPKNWLKLPKLNLALSGAAAAIVAVALAVALGAAAEHITTLPNISMVFLFAVLICAIGFGVVPAVFASGLSFLAYNFFFLDPRYSLTVAQPHELLSLLMFLVVAVATGSLAGRLHEQAEATHDRAQATQSLYEFSRKLAGAVNIDDVLWLLAGQCSATVKGRSVILLNKDGALKIEGSWPPEDDISTSDWAAARWANEKGEPAGRHTSTLPTAVFQFRPLVSIRGQMGVVGVAPDEDLDDLSSATEGALQSFIDQAALAIERTMLVEQAASAEKKAESERLRATLLSSVSHDLKTPLASILGSVTSLRQLGERMPKAAQGELLATIEEETQRLSSFVANLLDMTKIEAGALDMQKDLVDVGDVVRSAAARAGKLFPERKTLIDLDQGLLFVRGDVALLQQAVFNLLDNSNKYSGPQSHTRIGAHASGRNVTIAVSDNGIGIPAGDLEKIFDKFYRVAGVDGRAAGTGLGLSIAAGLIQAMGGSIHAESPIKDGKGTRMTIVLPVAAASQDPNSKRGMPA